MTNILIDEIEAGMMPDPHRRIRAVTARKQGAGSEEKYDFSTLFYGAVQAGDEIILICPKLLNFQKELKQAKILLDGKKAGRPRIRNYYRHSMVHIPAPGPTGTVRIELQSGAVIEHPVAQPRFDLFRGLNCEMLISKNNRLEWIEEHVTHHVRNHHLEGLVFIDNGSTDYGLQDIEKALSGAGLKSCVIMSMPFPWGGQNFRPYVNKELFLQTAAYNLVKWKYLFHARAVLRVDVDEILHENQIGNVFDLTEKSHFGFQVFDGAKRYPRPESTAPFAYSDHTFRMDPDRVGGGNWCLKPDGKLKNFQWRCHNLEGFPLKRLVKLPGSWYYDCEGVTTGWKSSGRLKHREDTVLDEDTVRFFETFPRAGGGA
ncbi:MAG: hypothetical protein HUJ27_17070 [Rhodobacteraceae bacterium]|nr:hypothetical protein [Paracoccaceae bacterium]